MPKLEEATSIFEKKTIIQIITNLEGQLRANGPPQKETARRWAQLGHFYGRMGDKNQQRFALKQALHMDPDNNWAKNQLAAM